MNYLIVTCRRGMSSWLVERRGAPKMSYDADMTYQRESDAVRVALEYAKDVVLSHPLSYQRDQGRPIGFAEAVAVDKIICGQHEYYVVVIATTATRAVGGIR